jgi:D-glycero-alpha-D-manno-heptose-7-phosphate kinase
MFYLGGRRSASKLLLAQRQNTLDNPAVVESLKAMVQQARALRGDLCRDVDALGPYLHEGWMRKRSLTARISNPVVELAYEKALAAGATGGKLLGAGGSGFLLLYAPADTRQSVAEALSDYEMHPVVVDTAGSTIIYSD